MGNMTGIVKQLKQERDRVSRVRYRTAKPITSELSLLPYAAKDPHEAALHKHPRLP